MKQRKVKCKNDFKMQSLTKFKTGKTYTCIDDSVGGVVISPEVGLSIYFNANDFNYHFEELNSSSLDFSIL